MSFLENTNEVIKSISEDLARIDTDEITDFEQIDIITKLNTLRALEIIAVNLAVIADRIELNRRYR